MLSTGSVKNPIDSHLASQPAPLAQASDSFTDIPHTNMRKVSAANAVSYFENCHRDLLSL
jgi:hypothetical protein